MFKLGFFRNGILLFAIVSFAMAIAGTLEVSWGQQVEKPALTKWKETGVIRVGWATWYPFTYKDPKTNEVKGVLIDFFKKLGEDLKLKVEYVEDSWATFIVGLKGNKFDVWSTANITVPRAMEMSFTDGYMLLPCVFLVTKDWLKEHPQIKHLRDMDRREFTFAVTRGARTDTVLTKLVKQANIKRITGAVVEGMMELKSKRVDAYFDGGLAVLAAIKEQPGLVAIPGSIGGQPLAIGVRQGDYVTREFLNIYIQDAKREGVIKELYEKYWGDIADVPAEQFLID